MPALPVPSNDNIRAALGLFLQPGGVIEIRVPNVGGKKRTDAGYFDDLDAAVTAAVEYSGTAPAVYVTLNPCNPALLARAKNRMEEYAKATTADPDVTRRLWLLVDCDPKRPSDISSTDSEQLASIALAYQIQDFLVALGFPPGIIGSSGNGGHLLYRIDLPNDAESLALVARCLESLAGRFNTPGVTVDTRVGNAARITKLYGTLVCKGDDTPERPHRVSRLFSTEPPAVVSREQLEALAALGGTKTATPTRVPLNSGNFIDGFIERHRDKLDLREPKDWQGGRLWVFNTCPFDASHDQNGATQLIQMASGAIVASCHHERCKGKGWADLRQMLEPVAVRHPLTGETAPPRREGAGLQTVRQAQASLGTHTAWLVDRMLAVGDLSILVAKPGVGKSTLAGQLAVAVAYGKDFLGRRTRQGLVLYFAFEGARRTMNHMVKLGHDIDSPSLLVCHDEANKREPMAWLRSVLGDQVPALIIIDSMGDFTNTRHGAANAGYEDALDKLGAVYRWALEHRVHVMLLHHAGKGEKDGIDAALGTMAVVAKPGTVLDYRSLSATEDAPRVLKGVKHREGDIGDLPAVVLDFDPATEVLAVGGLRGEVNARELALALLKTVVQSPGITRPELLESVKGRKELKLEALRLLCDPETGVLTRSGGERATHDPFRYQVRADLPPYPGAVEVWRKRTRKGGG